MAVDGKRIFVYGSGMGRPRSRTNDEILDAVGLLAGRHGPEGVTLAAVSALVGLAPATILQRFGSRAALVEAFAAREVARTRALFAGAEVGPPLQVLRRVLRSLAVGLPDPRSDASGVAFFAQDLRDPALRKLAVDHACTLRQGVEGLLVRAVQEGELNSEDTARLARVLVAAFHGALVGWALVPEGALVDAVDEALDVVLEGHRV